MDDNDERLRAIYAAMSEILRQGALDTSVVRAEVRELDRRLTAIYDVKLRGVAERVDSVAEHAADRADAFETYVLNQLSWADPPRLVKWYFAAMIIASFVMSTLALLK